MKRRHFLKFIGAGMITLAYQPVLAQQDDAIHDRVENLLNQMTLRQKIGQLFMCSADGTTFNAAMRQLVQAYQVGGIAFFDYNISTPAALATLSNELQASAFTPLLLAIDQEGGRVQRLKGDAFSDFPSPMALGAANDPDLTSRVAAAIAAEMSACGLNMNFAPVLDVNRQPRNPIINVRSFSSDPGKVAQHGTAFITGTQGAGVIATGKHFPGHGSTIEDSHYTLPTVDLENGKLMDDLAPFQAGAAAQVGMMMTAHILYPALDVSAPATFSHPITSDLLRDQLHFEGVVISDALTMGAVTVARSELQDILRDALNAGVNMLAYGAQPDGRPPDLGLQIAAIESVIQMAENGALDEAIITAAARRILTLKANFGILDWQPTVVNETASRINLPAHQELLNQVASRSITLYQDLALQLPVDPAQPLAILYPDPFPQIGEILKRDLPDALVLAFPRTPQVADANFIAAQLGDRRVICFTYDVHRFPEQVNVISVLPLDRTVVVAALSPYDLLSFPQVQTYLMTYGISDAALAAVRAVIFGEALAWGQLPISLNEA